MSKIIVSWLRLSIKREGRWDVQALLRVVRNLSPALMRACFFPPSLTSPLARRCSATNSIRLAVLASIEPKDESESWCNEGEGIESEENERRSGKMNEQGLSLKRTAAFLRGFFFWAKGRLVLAERPARRTDWISSELMIRVTSGLVILEMGRLSCSK